MNIVITATGNDVNTVLDKRFGRAAWFCLYNLETKETNFIQNEYVNATGGAGTKVAELMVKLEVKKVISGDFGPKAKTMLEKFSIQMVTLQKEQKIKDIIRTLN